MLDQKSSIIINNNSNNKNFNKDNYNNNNNNVYNKNCDRYNNNNKVYDKKHSVNGDADNEKEQQQRFQEWLESQNLTYEQWVEHQNQQRAQQLEQQNRREAERYRQQREEWEHEQCLLRRSPGFEEGIDEILQERQLDQYLLEIMSPRERQAICEQEQLNELQGNPTPQPHGLPMDDLEQYATHQGEQLLWKDLLERIRSIDDMEQWDEHEQQYQNEEQLIQKEQWEEIVFLHQQLQQPISYSL